jgi:type IV pilus assembly protein PilE
LRRNIKEVRAEMKGTYARLRANGGFTLIELMIVIVVVAVLAMVAYPAYQNYLIKGNRALTQAYVMKMAQRQQLYFNDARAYATDPNDLGVVEPERVTKFYAVTLVSDPNELPPTFLISADPRSGTPQEDDGLITIDNAGTKLRGGEPW